MAFLRCLILIPLLLLAACSRPSAPPPVVADGEGKPALWKVTGGKAGGAAYIFGTVHVLPPDTDWQSPAIDKAVSESRSLVTEVTGLDDKQSVSAIFSQLAVSAGLPPLEQRVPADLKDELEIAVRNVDAPAHVLGNMESWAAALTIAASASSGLGLEAASGADAVLQRRFQAMGRPHQGLETISQQFGYFDALPEAQQRIMLAAVIRDTGKAKAQMQTLLDRWMKGDADGLLQDTSDGVMASPQLRAVLLDNRNRRWAGQLAAMIDEGRKPFVAVGAAHVAGDGGVPALLAARGYRVERVQ